MSRLVGLPDELQALIWRMVHADVVTELSERLTRIRTALRCFRDMGGCDGDIHAERLALLTNPAYYDHWCGDLESWVVDVPPPKTYLWS